MSSTDMPGSMMMLLNLVDGMVRPGRWRRFLIQLRLFIPALQQCFYFFVAELCEIHNLREKPFSCQICFQLHYQYVA